MKEDRVREAKVREEKTAAELRHALAETRSRVASDLSALGSRLEQNLSLRGILARHPVLVVASGAFLGVLLVRRPGALLRAAGGLAGWGLPLLLTALFKEREGGAPR